MEDYKIDNPEIKKKLRELAEKLKGEMPKGWGFTLLMFDYQEEGEEGSMFYISSAQRADMIKVMKEFIWKNE